MCSAGRRDAKLVWHFLHIACCFRIRYGCGDVVIAVQVLQLRYPRLVLRVAVGGLVSGHAGDFATADLAGHCQQLGNIPPQGLDVLRPRAFQQRAVAEQQRLAGAAQHRLPGLLQIGPRRGAIGIVPAAAALRAADSAQPAHDEIALVLRRAAPALVGVIASFRAHPDAVEVGRLPQHFVAPLVKLVVPLRILDDQPGLGVDPPGGRQETLLRHADHQLASVIFPRVSGHRVALPAHGREPGLPGGITLLALAVGEPEVVDHRLVEQPGGVLEDRLEPLLSGLVGIAGDAVPAGGGLADIRRRDATGDLEARHLETLLSVQKGLALRLVAVAEDFHVDLGHGRPPAPVDGRVDAAVRGKVIPDLRGREDGREAVDVLFGLGEVPECRLGLRPGGGPPGVRIGPDFSDRDRREEDPSEPRIGGAGLGVGENGRIDGLGGHSIEQRAVHAVVAEQVRFAAAEDVARHEVHVRVGLQPEQFRVTRGIGRRGGLCQESSDRAEPSLLAPTREADSRRTVKKQVAVDEVLFAAVDLDSAKEGIAAVLENVAVDRDAGNHVVQPHAGRPALRSSTDIAPAVPADDNPAVQGVAPHVQAALVVGLLVHVPDQVQLDQMVVALDTHCRGRHALEQAVGDAVAAAPLVQQHGRGVGPLVAGDIGDRAVLHKMPAGRERFGITAADLCPAAAQRLHRAAEDAVPLAAGDDDRVAAQPPQRAARDQAIGPAVDVDPVAAAILKCQPEQNHVRDVLQNHKRFGANAEGSSAP